MNKILVSLLCIIAAFSVAKSFSEKADVTEFGEVARPDAEQTVKATFAGGCFWCMQPPFDKLDGVISTTVGYTGGPEKNPTYKEVAYGKTGHAEGIEIVYDPTKISYTQLLNVFWRNIDPTTRDGQFVDRGRQYRTAIFYHNDDQHRLAKATKEELEKSGRFDKPIVTEITPASGFYPAEEYHQKYYIKKPVDYKRYRRGSGRDEFLERIWGSG